MQGIRPSLIRSLAGSAGTGFSSAGSSRGKGDYDDNLTRNAKAVLEGLAQPGNHRWLLIYDNVDWDCKSDGEDEDFDEESTLILNDVFRGLIRD